MAAGGIERDVSMSSTAHISFFLIAPLPYQKSVDPAVYTIRFRHRNKPLTPAGILNDPSPCCNVGSHVFVVFSFFVAYFLYSYSTFQGACPGMTQNQESSETLSEKKRQSRENRKRIFLFVAVFVITTLVLLTSYRYLIPTRINDWYLFQAARHTAWVLDRIGHGEVEPLHYSRLDIKGTRAALQAWKKGKESLSSEETALLSDEPLSAWERWSWRAVTTRKQDARRVNGPRVYFVFREGISSRINSLSGKINQLEAQPDSDAPALQSELEHLKNDVQALRQEQQEGKEDLSLVFPFILVPECGAIEIMAIFVAAILAFPTCWRKRVIGLAAGIPVMYGVNIFRLTVLAIIGAVDQSRVWFNLAHEYVWQAVYIIFVVAVWLVWVEYVVKRVRS
jgi:exosortase/archaeosortase family protein